MINQQNIHKINIFFLITCLLFTTFLSLRIFKKVNADDFKIYGSILFSKKDIIKNSSLNFPTRLIFIKTKYLENELKQNLSLKNVSINRQIFPFGLKIIIQTRIPVALGERELNGQKVLGYIDEYGFFINENFSEKLNLEKVNIQIIGWQEKFKKTISEILKSHKNKKFELIKISFSPNGYLTIEEKDLNIILLGFNRTILKSQLQIISNLKNQLKMNNFMKKIDNIDLTDVKNPKIKVFKP